MAKVMLSFEQGLFSGGDAAGLPQHHCQKMPCQSRVFPKTLGRLVYRRNSKPGGATRMRVVGLLGISSVIGGFVLVLWKIARRRRSFPWLIRHQLIVPFCAIYFYVMAPIDTLVHGYNVHQILNGRPEPSVQISEHPIDDTALPVLIPLLDAQDATIREGIRAMLSS